ncbi:hypothetical protein ACOYW6_07550 [Parablastomonas sp. CN1-191]|uniref:hypothetical protein n=1 Tax=Parablastomonas sp. CN1-191 TaxID=3400908 RepID=UPI003BF7DDBF
MTRKFVLIASAAALLAPLPSFAAEQPADRDAADMARVAETMRNPAAQAAMGDAMAAMMGALLDMPAAPFLKAAQAADTAAGKPRKPAPPVRDGARLRDLAGAGAADAPRQVGRAVPVMMGGMAGMTEAMGKMLPQLREMGARMGEAMGQAQATPATSAPRNAPAEPAAGTAEAPAT